MMTEIRQKPQAEQLAEELSEHSLVLYNDHVNTFDWVIESLIEICEHTVQQAEQCAYLVHHKGKYAVRHGSEKDLLPRCSLLLDRGLTAEVV